MLPLPLHRTESCKSQKITSNKKEMFSKREDFISPDGETTVTSMSTAETPIGWLQESRIESVSCPTPEILRLNVGGHKFMLLDKNVDCYPNSFLSRFLHATHTQRCEISNAYLDDTGEYFFDRSGELFEIIANSYRTGAMHVPDHVCRKSLSDELTFWGVSDFKISSCCSPTFSHELANSTNFLDSEVKADDSQALERSYQNLKCGRIRYKMWLILERPGSSHMALAFMFLSITLICATMVVLVMSSLEQFQRFDSTYNETVSIHILDKIDAVCVISFTIEYLARLWSSADRWEYLKSGMSVIDLIAILPFYVEQGLNAFGVEDKLFVEMRRSILLVRVLRVMRILRALRILKVARYSMGFQSMGETLKRSWRELALLIMFMLTTNLMFSTAMYFIEHDHDGTHFKNIPSACWWCIITMTTVGYGDVYPQTIGGKILASAVSITGIILLAFPISVIVDTFNQEYQERQGTAQPEVETETTRLTQDPNQVRVIDGKVFLEMQQPGHRRKAGKLF